MTAAPNESESDTNLSPQRRAWANKNLDPEARTLLAEDEKYFLRQSVSTPCLNVIVKAEGIWIEDTAGRRYMDFHGNNVHHIGYGHPRLKEAIRRQLDALPFAPRRFTCDPAVELDVLQAERRARPDGHLRIGGDGAELAVELQRQLRADPAAGQRDRLHPRDDADAEAARADLVAGDEVRAVREVDLELRRGHERQARVRVVREEDGDDDHEHGHGADEHRARNDGGAVAADRAHGLRR